MNIAQYVSRGQAVEVAASLFRFVCAMKRAKKTSSDPASKKTKSTTESHEKADLKKGQQTETNPPGKAAKIFNGAAFYFPPGSKYSVPVKKLKDAVLAQGAVLHTSIGAATYMVTTHEKVAAGFASDDAIDHDQLPVRVVTENFIHESIKGLKVLPVEPFLILSKDAAK